MDRRGFLRSILAAAASPMIVKAESLMPIVTRQRLFYENEIITLYRPLMVKAGQTLYMRGCLIEWRGPQDSCIIDLHPTASGTIESSFFLANDAHVLAHPTRT